MKKHPLLAGAFPVLKKREVEKRVPITQTLQNRCDLDVLIIGAGFERGVSHLKIKDDQFVKPAGDLCGLLVDNLTGALLQ